MVARSQCIYGQCRAVNLCKYEHCVGAEMEKQGYEFAEGEFRRKVPDVDIPPKTP